MREGVLARAAAYTSMALGLGSLIWFTVFLYEGSFSLWDFGLNTTGLLLVDALLSLGFFLQHSIMLRQGFRNRIRRYIPNVYEGAFFAASSSLALFTVLILWQKSPLVFYSAEGVYFIGFRVLFLVSVAGFIWAARSLGTFDPFGAESLLLHAKNQPPKVLPLRIQGPYRFVRHPVYGLSLLMIWSSPEVSADRVLFNLLWSLWIIIGAWLEEKDLVRNFGESYRAYQKSTPMLFPFKRYGKSGKAK